VQLSHLQNDDDGSARSMLVVFTPTSPAIRSSAAWVRQVARRLETRWYIVEGNSFWATEAVTVLAGRPGAAV